MALSSDLAAVFSLIQQQQALEERKAERHQDTALAILSMDMREAESARNILVKEYYDKKAEVRQTEDAFDEYSNLKPSDVSQGGRDLISIVDKQNKIDMDAITQNLTTLSTYQSSLESSLGELSGQAQTLQEMKMDFAGANRVLEPHEYEAFQEHALTAIDEGGLGWSTTAGADVEYYKTDPTARYAQALQMTERMQKTAKTGAEGHYAILQAIYTPGEDEDTGDLADKLTYEVGGREIEPSEEVVSAIQSMAGQSVGYDDFLTNLNAYPAAAGGDVIRAELASNPNTAQLFNNLKRDADLITTLDNELAGINEPDEVTDFENFVSDISGVTNPEALFSLYDQAIVGKDPALHDQFFNAIEAQLGGIDAGEAYMTFKGFYDPPEELPPETDIELQASIENLSNKQSLLWDAGFYNTPEYQNISDSLGVLNQELREKENYRTYVEEIERKMSQGDMSEDELSELSSTVGISVEDLRRMVTERNQQQMISPESTRRAFYETGLKE